MTAYLVNLQNNKGSQSCVSFLVFQTSEFLYEFRRNLVRCFTQNILLILLTPHSPLWTLASNKILHSFRSLAILYQFLVSTIFRSFSTLSVYLFRWFSLFLIPSILAVTICFAILSLFNPSVYPYHLNLRN